MNYSWLKSTTWAVLTNFKQIKVYNAQWQSQNVLDKLFFTLETDELITKFDKLWLLSKDSFLSNELDSVAEEWGKKRKRTPVTPVTDQLFDDLITWRQRLTKDISQNKANTELLKSDQDLDECVQRIIDRLIFIRVCEDRKIEPVTLLSRLREWKGTRKGRSFYSLLVDVFREFDSIYNSNLFGEHPSDRLKIDDLLLNQIIYELYESKDHLEYDFAAIDSDVLGNIYEQYLGYMLQKHKKGVVLTESYEQRRKFGAYYTPPYIVKFIIQNTIQQVFLENSHQQVRVLDPACGSGSFLIEALSTIITQSKASSFEEKVQALTDSVYGIDLDPKAVEIAQLNLLLRILEKGKTLPKLGHNIQCGNSIIEDSAVAGDKAFNWEKRFSQLKDPLFDAVIGNPPYVSWTEIDPREPLESGQFLDLAYRCRPNHKDAQPNLYLFFIVRALSRCKNRFGFILPTEWLGANYARDFRDYIINNSNKITIFKFDPNYKVFTTHGTVGTNSLILIADKKSPDHTVEQYQIIPSEEQEVKKALQNPANLKKASVHTEIRSSELLGKDWNILSSVSVPQSTILASTVTLDNREYFEVVGGFQPPVDRIADFELNDSEFETIPESERVLIFPAVLNAHSIKRYIVEDERRYWVIANDLDLPTLQNQYSTVFKLLSNRISTKTTDWWKYPNIRNISLFKDFHSKLLSPRTASENTFAVDTQATLFKGTNTAIISKKLDPFFLAAVLNSKFANVWYEQHGTEYHGGEAKKYEPDKVRNCGIPIPLASPRSQTRIAKLVQEEIALMKSLSRTTESSDAHQRIADELSELETTINAEVDKVYQQSEE
ncbi:MAG: N-6 DNA methylase, partial [Bryobacteraceae bacterium]